MQMSNKLKLTGYNRKQRFIIVNGQADKTKKHTKREKQINESKSKVDLRLQKSSLHYIFPSISLPGKNTV